MPTEPLPWDRRDFRKHDRSGPDHRFGGGGPTRWRDQHHGPPPPHPYHHHQQRWYNDFRPNRPGPSGHGKQGGWNGYSEDSSNGYLPFASRFNDDDYRPFPSRGDGRYFRNGRDNRGSFTPKDWKAQSWEPMQKDSKAQSWEPAHKDWKAQSSDPTQKDLKAQFWEPTEKDGKAQSWEPTPSPSGSGRLTGDMNDQKTAESKQTYTSNNKSSSINDLSNSCRDPVTLLDQHQSFVNEQHDDKIGGDADGLVFASQKIEKENSLGSIEWKHLKWTRSGSLSSRGSGFSHSVSPKSMGAESNEMVAEGQKNATTLQSPSGEAAACVTSGDPVPSEDTTSRKKPRLGWGEGLAKYEKKKVGDPEDGSTIRGLVTAARAAEIAQSNAIHLADKSPRTVGSLDCASPATPSSLACSSSSGIEENQSLKATKTLHHTPDFSFSPSTAAQTHNDGPAAPQTQYDGPAFSLEKLELSSVDNLSTLIDSLRSVNQSVVGGFLHATEMNKLLLWKVDILRALEGTESEIDSLETELKLLMPEFRDSCADPAAISSSMSRDCLLKTYEQNVAASNLSPKTAVLQLEDGCAKSKDEDVDSPGSATSMLVELPPSGEVASASEAAKHTEDFMFREGDDSSNLDVKCLQNAPHDDKNITGAAPSMNDLPDTRGLYKLIMASNKDQSKETSDVLNKLLPAKKRHFNISETSSFSCIEGDTTIIKRKFLLRKRFVRFKEKVIVLKFKVFQHFWKEGRQLSVRKLLPKSHKKLDSSRTLNLGYPKHRSCSRSRSSLPAGNYSSVSMEEATNYVKELLSDSHFNIYRNTLKMPALIVDQKEKRISKFISSNGLVENPCAVEKERSMINPWTSEDKEIFIDKLVEFGKDFRKIASFLDGKTTADCIEFYYKNHKSEYFEKSKDKLGSLKEGKSQLATTYLVAAGTRCGADANAVSLDVLGAASAIAANLDDGMEVQQNSTSKFFFGGPNSYKAPKDDEFSLQRSDSLDFDTERETVAADVLAGICGSLSSEGMSSSITTSIGPGDDYRGWTGPRRGLSTRPLIDPNFMHTDDDEFSDESCGEMDPTDWTDEEKSIFIQAVSSHGKDFAMISRCVGTRSRDQCRIFFSKARKVLGLGLIQAELCDAVCDDISGGGGDMEDACVVETGSVICSERSGCKVDNEFPTNDAKSDHDLNVAGTLNLKRDNHDHKDEGRTGSLDSVDTEPVAKHSVPDGYMAGRKMESELDADCNEQNGAVSWISARDPGTAVVESAPVVEDGDEPAVHNTQINPESIAAQEISEKHQMAGNVGQGVQEQEDRMDMEKGAIEDASLIKASGVSCSTLFIYSVPQLASNVTNLSADSYTSKQFDFVSCCQKISDFKGCSAEKYHVMSSQQSDHLASFKSSSQCSAPIKDHKGYSVPGSVETSPILRGYPLAIPPMKEVNADVNCRKSISLECISKSGNFHSDQHTDFSLKKCNGSRHQGSVADSSASFQDSHSTAEVSNSSNVEKPCKNGKFKLFGKVLNSTEQTPDSGSQKNDVRKAEHNREGNQSLNLKFSSDQTKGLALLKFGREYLSSEESHMRSFSIWDGNRTQIGFPPVTDSTRLQAKYPAAFGSFPMPSATLEHAALQGVVNSNQRTFNVYPTRELSSSSGVVDFPSFRNREMQPFTIMRQPQDSLFERQRINGNEVSGIQQQAKGIVGFNIVGGGVLVGGQCPDVSDPVAALRMHYANTDQFSVQAGKGIIEDESWRIKGM